MWSLNNIVRMNAVDYYHNSQNDGAATDKSAKVELAKKSAKRNTFEYLKEVGILPRYRELIGSFWWAGESDWYLEKSPQLFSCENIWFDIPLASYGEYCNSTVERANQDALMEQWKSEGFEAGEYWDVKHEPYEGRALMVRCDAVEALGLYDHLEALSNYPVVDEERLSALELALEDHAWDDWAREEFRRDLEHAHDVDLSDVSNDDLQRVFLEARDAANEYWVHDGPNSPWIDIARVASKVNRSDVLDLPGVVDELNPRPDALVIRNMTDFATPRG